LFTIVKSKCLITKFKKFVDAENYKQNYKQKKNLLLQTVLGGL